MEPITAAKIAATAAKLLLKTDEEGNTGFQKLAIAIATSIFLLLILYYVAVQVFLLPMNSLTAFFLPESITEAKRSLDTAFIMPSYDVPKISLMAFPVDNSSISSGYGYRRIPGRPNLSFHEGIDFPVAFDTEVMSIAPGIVVKTGVNDDYGSYIMIKHVLRRYDKDDEWIETETLYSFYAHLYKIYVFEGQRVKERQQIATSGGDSKRHFAGNTTGAHLHLELRRTEEYESHFNPYSYVLDPDPFDGKTKSIRWG